MKRRWDDEVERVLANWALWLAGSNGRSGSPSPAYNLAMPGPRAGNVMPILGGEAVDADDVVRRMPLRLQSPLRMHYCWPGRSDRSKAASCSCSLNTYKARLVEAHELFQRGWYGRDANRAA